MKSELTVYNFSSTPNTGDRYCSPTQYFEWMRNCPVKMPGEWMPGNSIFGGGGLLYGGTEQVIYEAIESGQRIAIWGAGLNRHGEQTQQWPEFLSRCVAVGLRDPGNPWEFVPCPSCMAREFNALVDTKPIRPIGVYEHYGHPFSEFLDAPSMNNIGHNLEETLRFISASNVVVTNSFHGVYWTLLLRRTPIIFEPFSNRFMSFPSAPVANRNTVRDVIETARNLPVNDEWLERSRDLNRDWSERLRKLFSL